MEVYVDGELTASSQSNNISTRWNTRPRKVASGEHTITVMAYDASGNVGEHRITVIK